MADRIKDGSNGDVAIDSYHRYKVITIYKIMNRKKLLCMMRFIYFYWLNFLSSVYVTGRCGDYERDGLRCL